MATNFWSSSHYKRWLVDRSTLAQARSDDVQYVDTPDHLAFLNIFFANLISKLGKKLQLRQRVIATATVFFRRFYLKNSYCETDPFLVIAACCYVAAKAEESPVHIKNVVSEARMLFANEEYGIKTFPSDNSKIAEMEFYLVDELECNLTVFHPYRTLMTLCGKEGAAAFPEAEAGEADADDADGPRYWGTGEGKLELQEGALQMAWFIINDTYRSELCLLYPPHLIAIAAIYLTLAFHAPTRAAIQQQTAAASSASTSSHSHSHSHSGSPTRRSSRSASYTQKKPSGQPPPHAPQDIVGFMAGLNVSVPLVAAVAQEIVALYALWDRYSEDEAARAAYVLQHRPLRRGRGGADIPAREEKEKEKEKDGDEVVTPVQLVQLLLHMREQRSLDVAHPQSGRSVPINKRLERTQAAG